MGRLCISDSRPLSVFFVTVVDELSHRLMIRHLAAYAQTLKNGSDSLKLNKRTHMQTLLRVWNDCGVHVQFGTAIRVLDDIEDRGHIPEIVIAQEHSPQTRPVGVPFHQILLLSEEVAHQGA
eukprot:GHVU01219499.1.p1 GENE.GHVU01219499.1~~GHVU01219499.1.p1  ORF type:complete len:122 (-),score=3.76 GHVU01219499.1:169-534(-)